MSCVKVAAQSVLASAQSSYNSAQSAFNTAQSSFNSAQSAYTTSSSAATAANNAAQSSSSSGSTFTTTTTTFGRQDPVNAGLPAGTTLAVCYYDYLLIDGGRDITNAVTDRYCGNKLNPSNGASTSVQVCSKYITTICIYIFSLIATMGSNVLISLQHQLGHSGSPTARTVLRERWLQGLTSFRR